MSGSPEGFVLDASALLAYLRGEPGGAEVADALLGGAVMNAVNYAEVLSRLGEGGADARLADERLRASGVIGEVVEVVALDALDALEIARLRPVTRAAGLSLADRACLATGLRLRRPVLTADRASADLAAGVEVRLIR